MRLSDATTSNDYADAMRDAGLRDNEPQPDANGRVPGDGLDIYGCPTCGSPDYEVLLQEHDRLLEVVVTDYQCRGRGHEWELHVGRAGGGAVTGMVPATDHDIEMARAFAIADVPIGGRAVLQILARLEVAEREAAAGRVLAAAIDAAEEACASPACDFSVCRAMRAYRASVNAAAVPEVAT